MTKNTLILALCLCLCASVFAKQAPSRDQRMVSQLSLTADQKAKLDPILDDANKKLRSLRADTALNAADKKAKSEEVRKDTDTKMKTILTGDQWKKLQDMRSEGKKSGSKKKS